MESLGVIVLLIFGFTTAYSNPVLKKLDSVGLRYQYIQSSDGTLRLVDQWQTLDDLVKASRYDPDAEIEYHLFSRANPLISQPLLNGNVDLLEISNYNVSRRTVVLIHGMGGSASDDFNALMTNAFLTSDDVNIIVVGWHEGSVLIPDGVISSGLSIARFISWLKSVTGQTAEDFHVVGFSMGVHNAGITSRNVEGGIGYVTGLDPAPGWQDNEQGFKDDDGLYTEVIYTNLSYLGVIADVTFYPNGGLFMPGCDEDDFGCNHFRACFYKAEALVVGGFTGRECATVEDALAGTCDLPGRMQMGSPYPSYGAKGIYYLETNASPPFSKG